MPAKFPKPLIQPTLNELIYDLTSEEYHSVRGTYSSSQLKDLLEDEEIFVKKHIHKTIEREEIDAFSVGSYFHTGILEPHKLNTDCVVYPGKVRRGAEWETFKAKHKNKAIVSQVMKDQAEGLIEVVQDSPIAMGLIAKGKSEVSYFTELNIWNGAIYSLKHKKVLTEYGWESIRAMRRDGAVNMVFKVRADSIGDDFILDLKSTTGNARSRTAMREKIKYYDYDLSAALYMDLFNLEYQSKIQKFIWTFASKDYFNCRSYNASEKTIHIGRKKWMKAVLKLAEMSKNDWQVYDELEEMDPHFSELHYLTKTESDSDLL